MSKSSSMIDIDPGYLRRLMRTYDLSSEALLSQLKEKVPTSQLSLSTLNENIKNSRMSPENLNALKQFFNLSRKQMDILTKSKELRVFFRRERKIAHEDHAKDLVRDLVEIYSSVISDHHVFGPIPVYEPQDEIQFAKVLKTQLGLSSYRLSFNEIQSSAGDFGIFITFYPFEFLGFKKNDSRDYRAVSVNKDKKWFVFLDTRNSMEESLFDALQELSYIFLGQNSIELNTHIKYIDDFTYAVASEILTPASYFISHRSELIHHFSKGSQTCEGKLSLIQKSLGCTYETLIKALIKHDLIDQSVILRLHQWVQPRLQAEQLLLSELVKSLICPQEQHENSQYSDFFQLVKAAHLCGNVTEVQFKRIFASQS